MTSKDFIEGMKFAFEIANSKLDKMGITIAFPEKFWESEDIQQFIDKEDRG